MRAGKFAPLLALFAGMFPACTEVQSNSPAASPASAPVAASTGKSVASASRPASNGDASPKRPKLERLVSLVVQLGTPDSMHGEAKFSVKKRGESVTRDFDLELANGKPGDTFSVFLDGVPIGEIKLESNGEGQLEITGSDADSFPENFPELRAGSVVKVGEVLEGKFENKPPRSKNE